MASSNYGRHNIPHPDFNTPASGGQGTGLHGEVIAGFTKIGNNITGRWSGVSATLANNASISLQHDFGLASASLKVVVQEGTSVLAPNGLTGRYTITFPDNNNVTVQNTSGGTISNVSFYVYPVLYVNPGELEMTPTVNNQTGSNVTLGLPSTGIVRVTGDLLSINAIAAPSRARFLIVYNDQAAQGMTIINENAGATAANRIRTGTGANVVLAAQAALFLVYESVEARWLIVGGSGGGGNTVQTAASVSAAGTIFTPVSGSNVLDVAGNAAPVTASVTPFGTTPPLDGTEITLIGTSNTNTVQIDPNDAANGCVLNGSILLARYCALRLVYKASLARYVEISRTLVGGF